MRLGNGIAASVLAVFLAAGLASAQTTEKKGLTLDGARKVIAAAQAEARAKNAPGGVIAVVDEGGNLMALERLDGTFAAGATISIGKARTAVLFKRPTRFFEEIINKGRTAMAALPDSFFTPLQGGVPITIDGQIAGGVGVSGAASAAQDEELAMAGANAFSSPSASAAAAASLSARSIRTTLHGAMTTAGPSIFVREPVCIEFGSTFRASARPSIEGGPISSHCDFGESRPMNRTSNRAYPSCGKRSVNTGRNT